MKTAAHAIALTLVMAQFGASSAVDWTVHLRRAGPVRIGMTMAKTRRALDDPEAFLSWGQKEPDNAECAYIESRAIPTSVGLMFQKGRLVRIDVSAAGIRTASGAGVGDSEARIKEIYRGRIVVKPHHYDPDTGHYLNYVPADAADRGYGMVFEADGKQVTSYRTGLAEAVELVEGCN